MAAVMAAVAIEVAAFLSFSMLQGNRMSKPVVRAAMGAVFALTLAACGSGEQRSAANPAQAISIDGSSTVFPISEAAAEAFSAETTGGARVTVGESGTGGGFRKFCRGETQVQGVVSNAGAMGYFGFAYYEQNRERLHALAIDAGNGPIAPSAETIASGAYPLARPLFIYVSAEALRRPHVQRFAQYYVANAVRLAPQVGYVPLPEAAYAELAARLTEVRTGTAFGGVQDVHANIAEVLARPLVSVPAAGE